METLLENIGRLFVTATLTLLVALAAPLAGAGLFTGLVKATMFVDQTALHPVGACGLMRKCKRYSQQK